MLDQYGAGRQQQRHCHPAQGAGALDPAEQNGADGRDVTNAEPGRQQVRQHIAGYCSSSEQPGNRIRPKLGQPWKTRQQQ